MLIKEFFAAKNGGIFMSKSKNETLSKIITVLIGGLLLGMLWRARGEHGWGSEAGVFNVGFVFALFLSVVTGSRKKLDFGWLSVTAMSFIATVPAWGPLLNQITGVIRDTEKDGTQEFIEQISPASGIFMMLCLGFGLAGIYAILLGRGYSDKRWRVRDIVIIIAVFLVSDQVSRYTFSHWIVNLVQPEAATLFERGLEMAGVEGTAYGVYLEHWGDMSWAKKIVGGRNYFTEVQAVSSAVRALAALLTARFIIKDKVAAKIATVICCAFAVSITVSDGFFYLQNANPADYRDTLLGFDFYAWSCWEYFTGFIAGVIITAYMLSLRKTQDVPELAFENFPEKPKKVLVFMAGYLGTVGVNLVRPIILRFDSTETSTIIAAVAGVIFAAAVIALLVWKCGFNAEKISADSFYRILLAIFAVFDILLYFFVCTAEYRNWLEINMLHNVIFAASAVIVTAWIALSKPKAQLQK